MNIFYISNTDSFVRILSSTTIITESTLLRPLAYIKSVFIITNLRKHLRVAFISSFCGHLIIYFSLFDLQIIYTSDKNLVSKSSNESKPVENINIEILKRLLTIINI